ncbi:hypothetical protein ACLOJK_026420, partial [Asimina triloba]
MVVVSTYVIVMRVYVGLVGWLLAGSTLHVDEYVSVNIQRMWEEILTRTKLVDGCSFMDDMDDDCIPLDGRDCVMAWYDMDPEKDLDELRVWWSVRERSVKDGEVVASLGSMIMRQSFPSSAN